jgi:ribosomal protein S18 acetylase RimI-like enzyme
MSIQPDTLTISPLVIEDYDDVYGLWENSEGIGLSGADSQPRIAAYLLRNPGMSFVARIGELVVGAILCGHDGRRGYIHHLAVHDAYRRQGLGRSLVQQSLAPLQALGIQKCHLFIFHENLAAISFWKSMGWIFREDTRIMSTYIEEEDLSV